MTETTKAAARTITDRYVAVWSEPDPQSRRAAIASLWERDGVEYVEGTQFRGHEELDARIAHAYDAHSLATPPIHLPSRSLSTNAVPPGSSSSSVTELSGRTPYGAPLGSPFPSLASSDRLLAPGREDTVPRVPPRNGPPRGCRLTALAPPNGVSTACCGIIWAANECREAR